MCDSQTTKAIEDICIEKVNSQEMFTAFDVTTELRHRGFNEKHREVKGVVHGFFSKGGMGCDYNRTLQDVGAQIQPWIYHHKADDVRKYGKPAKNKPAASAPAKNKPAAATPVTGPSISVGGVACSPTPKKAKLKLVYVANEARADARGTVCIPSVMLQQAGFTPGDVAFVYAMQKSLLVVKDPKDAGSKINHTSQCRKYTVDRNCNVRVTRKSLTLAGIPAQQKGQKYQVSNGNSTVTLTV